MTRRKSLQTTIMGGSGIENCSIRNRIKQYSTVLSRLTVKRESREFDDRLIILKNNYTSNLLSTGRFDPI